MSTLIRQALDYARRCRSLWLFGFVVGTASGGSSAAGSAGSGQGAGAPLRLSVTELVPLVTAIVVVAVAAFVFRFISEGALIEGVVRVRDGGTMTMRDGFRAGWEHWGVLMRIALLYVATSAGSLVLLATPCVIAMKTVGPLGGLVLGLPALIIAVPWLITLYLVQAFAARIAVLENRHALDSIRKSRLFLHGRLMHGLALIVATLVGTVVIGLLGGAAILLVAALLAALMPVLHLVPVLLVGGVVLVPAVYVLTAMIGTFRSSIWTIGYVSQVDP